MELGIKLDEVLGDMSKPQDLLWKQFNQIFALFSSHVV